MSKFISVAALVIFVVAVGVNSVFFGDGSGGRGGSGGSGAGGGSGGADAANGGPGNPAGEEFISPDDIEVPDQPGGGVPVGEVDVRVKEGRTNGQRDFAREFVKTVYGFSEGSADASYLDSVSDYMQRDSYELSEGWRAIESREEGGGESSGESSGENGGENAAVMIEYEISQGQVLGTTVPVSLVEEFTKDGTLTAEDLDPASLVEVGYAVGDSYDESVEGGPEDYADASALLSGSVRYYGQTLILAPVTSPDGASGESERWTALAASEPVPIDNPNTDVPDPSAPKVADPGGGHGGGGHG
jgi:hypothetical protein